MNFKNVTFKGSFGTSKQIPKSKLPEISFVGRSNVGKSSLLNRLFNQKHLAHTSSHPGKTSTINFFGNQFFDFIDLPGYGYAKVSKSEKQRWSEMINGYFDQYRFYALVISLIDIRHPATSLDEQMITFLYECQLPFVIALTKADKLSYSQQKNALANLKKQLFIVEEKKIIVTSAQNGTGIDKIKKTIINACQ